jgi:hypothetical protein
MLEKESTTEDIMFEENGYLAVLKGQAVGYS